MSSPSNALEQMAFVGSLLTNKLVIAYDSTWKWTLYAGSSEDAIEDGEIEDFSPFDSTTTLTLTNSILQAYYAATNIVF